MALISFKTTRTVSGVNQLQVIQYDPTSCQIIAKGVGFEDTRVVRAVMRDQKQQTFNLTVHVFNRSDVRNGNMIAFAAKRVTVMNISTLDNPSIRSSYELEKMSSEANGVCK